MSTELQQIQLCEWILRKLEGTLSAEENKALSAAMNASEESIRIYNDMIILYTGLSTPGKVSLNYFGVSPSSKQLDDLLFSMSQTEKSAPALPMEESKKAAPSDFTRPTNIEKTVRKINKTSLGIAILSLAALILMMVYVILNPRTSSVNEVATVADVIDTQMLSNTFKTGSRLVASDTPTRLLAGVMKIISDKGVELVVEGPAEFRFDSVSEIKMNYGRLYAKVPPQGLGFSVSTPNTKIIDLGTEFGVLSNRDISTELHVFKGKTNLFALDRDQVKNSQAVSFGSAIRVDHHSEVQEIQFNKSGFIRSVSSACQIVWRGEDIDLADIVGGGNGFGTGRLNAGIDYNGNIGILDCETSADGPKNYIRVSSSAFIDGLFIPNGSTQIASDGRRYDFQKTNGRYWLGVLNGAWHRVSITASVPRHNLRLEGKVYGIPGNSAIYLSANQGVTFDLNAIRNYSQLEPTRFTALCGISETYKEYLNAMSNTYYNHFPKASFYVLIDGKPRFEKIDITPSDTAGKIEIPIGPEDHFLTLVATQGSDGTNTGDWTLFAEPVLQLK